MSTSTNARAQGTSARRYDEIIRISVQERSVRNRWPSFAQRETPVTGACVITADKTRYTFRGKTRYNTVLTVRGARNADRIELCRETGNAEKTIETNDGKTVTFVLEENGNVIAYILEGSRREFVKIEPNAGEAEEEEPTFKRERKSETKTISLAGLTATGETVEIGEWKITCARGRKKSVEVRATTPDGQTKVAKLFSGNSRSFEASGSKLTLQITGRELQVTLTRQEQRETPAPTPKKKTGGKPAITAEATSSTQRIAQPHAPEQMQTRTVGITGNDAAQLTPKCSGRDEVQTPAAEPAQAGEPQPKPTPAVKTSTFVLDVERDLETKRNATPNCSLTVLRWDRRKQGPQTGWYVWFSSFEASRQVLVQEGKPATVKTKYGDEITLTLRKRLQREEIEVQVKTVSGAKQPVGRTTARTGQPMNALHRRQAGQPKSTGTHARTTTPQATARTQTTMQASAGESARPATSAQALTRADGAEETVLELDSPLQVGNCRITLEGQDEAMVVIRVVEIGIMAKDVSLFRGRTEQFTTNDGREVTLEARSGEKLATAHVITRTIETSARPTASSPALKEVEKRMREGDIVQVGACGILLERMYGFEATFEVMEEGGRERKYAWEGHPPKVLRTREGHQVSLEVRWEGGEYVAFVKAPKQALETSAPARTEGEREMAVGETVQVGACSIKLLSKLGGRPEVLIEDGNFGEQSYLHDGEKKSYTTSEGREIVLEARGKSGGIAVFITEKPLQTSAARQAEASTAPTLQTARAATTPARLEPQVEGIMRTGTEEEWQLVTTGTLYTSRDNRGKEWRIQATESCSIYLTSIMETQPRTYLYNYSGRGGKGEVQVSSEKGATIRTSDGFKIELSVKPSLGDDRVVFDVYKLKTPSAS